MPTVVISPIGGAGQQFFDNNGDPLSGGKLYTYEAGTTTPATTYTSISGATPRTNPIVLDSAGRVSNDGTWLDASEVYKFVLKTSADVTLGTWDNIAGASSAPITIADASTTVKGITKLATAPVSASAPIAVGDNDPRLAGLPYTAPVDASTSAKGITKLGAAPVSASDPIAVGNNQWATSSAAGITRLSTAPAVAATPIAVGDNDGRVPSQGENDALVGTNGTPSSSNKYVTNSDPRLGGTTCVINVKASPYNATGDGTTDDTAAIQAAFDAAVVGGVGTPGYAQLYFPTGLYRITTSISGATPNGVHIKGDSVGGSIDGAVERGSLIKNTAGGRIFDFTISGETGAWEISDLGFVSSFSSAIRSKDSYYGYIHDCSFFGGTTAITLDTTFYVRVVNNVAHDVDYGVLDTNSTGLIIAGNRIDAAASAVDIGPSSNGSTYVTIVGNQFGSFNYGVRARNSNYLTVTGNVFHSSNTNAIGVQFEQSAAINTNSVISSNVLNITDAGGRGVYLYGAQNVNLSHNTISATKIIDLAINGAYTCGGTYYDGNIAVGYVVGVFGQITVGGGVTATAGTNINGV